MGEKTMESSKRKKFVLFATFSNPRKYVKTNGGENAVEICRTWSVGIARLCPLPSKQGSESLARTCQFTFCVLHFFFFRMEFCLPVAASSLHVLLFTRNAVEMHTLRYESHHGGMQSPSALHEIIMIDKCLLMAVNSKNRDRFNASLLLFTTTTNNKKELIKFKFKVN